MIALILTIVLLIILASVAAYEGAESIDHSKRMKFMAYMQTIQKKVDVLAQEGKYGELGQDISELNSTQINSIKKISQDESLSFSEVEYFPNTYQTVEYLLSSGSEYINTNIAFDFEKSLRIVGEVINPDLSARKVIIGSYNNANSGISYSLELGGTSSSYNGYLRNFLQKDTSKNNIYSNEAVPEDTLINYDTFYDEANHSITTTYKYNNTTKTYSDSVMEETGVATNTLRFFLDYRPNVSVIAAPVKIGKTVIYQDGIMVGCFVPVYRKSDSKPGLYNTVDNQFYTNSGTGEFVVGANTAFDSNNYIRYFNSQDIARDLEIDDVDDEIVINFKTREVLSLNGIKYKGQMYYTQYNLPGGQKLTGEASLTRTLNIGTIEKNLNGLNFTFSISNISISNGSLYYSMDYNPEDTIENATWKMITNYTNKEQTITTQNFDKSGVYYFKLEDNSDANITPYVSEGIVVVLVNDPIQSLELSISNDPYDYSDYENSIDDFAYSTNINDNTEEYVWIPRFAYREVNNTTQIEFLRGTSDITTRGGYITDDWTIPGVFENTTGVWVRTNSYSSDDIISIVDTGTILQ